MPTITRAARFRFYFYSHEPNEPPHVHVDRGGASAKSWLHDVSFAANAGFFARELGEVLKLVRPRPVAFLEAWHDYFGAIGER